MLSCQSNIEKPQIPESNFVEILTDLHYLEATLETLPPLTDTFFLANKKGYEIIFKNHGVSAQQFFTTFTYYENAPDKFEKIYEKIVIQLQEAEAQAKESKN